MLGRVLVSFANPAKLDAQRTKATPRAAGPPLAPRLGPHVPATHSRGVASGMQRVHKSLHLYTAC